MIFFIVFICFLGLFEDKNNSFYLDSSKNDFFNEFSNSLGVGSFQDSFLQKRVPTFYIKTITTTSMKLGIMVLRGKAFQTIPV